MISAQEDRFLADTAAHRRFALSRIPLIDGATLNPEQRRVYDKVVSGPRGQVVGPLRAALHHPELADRWQEFGEILRYRTSLPHRLNELAIILTGRHWNSPVEWVIHADASLRAGLAPELIEAIRLCQTPIFAHEDEAIVYEYTRQLLQHGHVSQPVYAAARERFDTVGLVELTALIGYYSMVAMTLNAHDVPVPEHPGPKLPPLPVGPEGLSPLAQLAPAPSAPPRTKAGQG
jgi:4-carboxymuconolactone decarboxylase